MNTASPGLVRTLGTGSGPVPDDLRILGGSKRTAADQRCVLALKRAVFYKLTIAF